MEKKEDFVLIDEFNAGNARAFDELLSRYKRRIYLTAYKILGNYDDADEITQEVFVKMYNNLGFFRKDSSLFTWLYKITTNLSLNELNRKKIKRFLDISEILDVFSVENEDNPEKAMNKITLAEKVRSAINSLPEKQKVVFTLRYYDELSYEEISKIAGTSVGALKANYFHALQKIGKELKNEL